MENDKKRRSEWTNKKWYIFITDEPQKGIEDKSTGKRKRKRRQRQRKRRKRNRRIRNRKGGRTN